MKHLLILAMVAFGFVCAASLARAGVIVIATADEKVDFKCCDGASFAVTDLEATWNGKIDSFSFRYPTDRKCDTSISGMTTKLLCKNALEVGTLFEATADATFVSAIWTGAGGQNTKANPVTTPELPTWLLFGTGFAGLFWLAQGKSLARRRSGRRLSVLGHTAAS